MHKGLDLLALAASATTVVLAGLHVPAPATAALAAATLFLEGARRLFAPGETWLRAAEAQAAMERVLARYESIPEAERTPGVKKWLLDYTSEVVKSEHEKFVSTEEHLQALERPGSRSRQGNTDT